jgi:hypothetical protein
MQLHSFTRSFYLSFPRFFHLSSLWALQVNTLGRLVELSISQMNVMRKEETRRKGDRRRRLTLGSERTEVGGTVRRVRCTCTSQSEAQSTSEQSCSS